MRSLVSVAVAAAISISCGCHAARRGAGEGTAKLVDAASKGDVAAASELISNGFDARTLNSLDGRLSVTPLHTAASEGHTQIVRLLLDSGVKTDLKDEHTMTALMWAAAEGRSQVAALLIDRGAEVNAETNDLRTRRFTPIIFAASRGHTETLRVLLDHGGDINGNSITTPLYISAAGGYEETVRFLLGRGARVTDSTMIRTIRAQNPRIANILQDHYCDQLPKPIGISSVDKPLRELRKLEGCK